MIFALIITLVFVVLAVVLPLATRGERFAARTERALPKAVGLDLPEVLIPSIRARNRSLVRHLSIGLGSGAVVGFLVSLLLPSLDGVVEFSKVWLVLGAVAIGAVIGTCIWVAREATRRATQDAPLQREKGVGLFDYLPTWSTVLAIVVVVLAIGIAAVLAWVMTTGAVEPGAEPLFVPIVIAFYAVVAALVLGLGFIAVQVHRPQRAASPEHLAWDDAVTVQAIFPIVYLAGFFAALLVGQLFTSVSSSIFYSDRSNEVRSVLLLLVAAPLPIYVLALVSIVAKPARHFVKRLWPAVPAAPNVPPAV